MQLRDYAERYAEFQNAGYITPEGEIDRVGTRLLAAEIDGFRQTVQAVINAKAMIAEIEEALGVDVSRDEVVSLEGNAAGEFNTQTRARRFDKGALQQLSKKEAVHVGFHEVLHWKHHTRKQVEGVLDRKTEEAATEWAASKYSGIDPIAYGKERTDLDRERSVSRTELAKAYEAGDVETIQAGTTPATGMAA